ncbi:MAG: tRNA guanosine(34) transglycosylase Tgt [Candidatus Magasanikbacteria bacterium]
MSFFELQHIDKKTGARAGVMHTDHGDIETPCFMPVGTQATVKTLDSQDLENLGAPIILGNTYHLHLRPGEDLIEKSGGLHKFMNWPHPILTDSGGFQVFSLGEQKNKKQNVILSDRREPKDLDSSTTPLRGSAQNDKTQGALVKITDDGVEFRSHIDGSKHFFSPESAIEIQHKLGADIIMAFDECTPDSADEKYTREAMVRTHAWAKRCVIEHQKNTHHDYRQFLFGIIQGAKHKDLREESAKFISALDFDGIAIGGESIGYNMEATTEILDWVMPLIPADKPHYTMGVGLDPDDLLKVVAHGADMFDCVAPTRLARHGMVYLSPSAGEGVRGSGSRLNLTNATCATDAHPIDDTCQCHTCQNYSRAYLHHLFMAQEITGMRLATIHNIHYMLNLMRTARQAILEDKFETFLKN